MCHYCRLLNLGFVTRVIEGRGRAECSDGQYEPGPGAGAAEGRTPADPTEHAAGRTGRHPAAQLLPAHLILYNTEYKRGCHLFSKWSEGRCKVLLFLPIFDRARIEAGASAGGFGGEERFLLFPAPNPCRNVWVFLFFAHPNSCRALLFTSTLEEIVYNYVGVVGDKLGYQLCVYSMRVMDAVQETVSFTASITLIKTQLIHQFMRKYADCPICLLRWIVCISHKSPSERSFLNTWLLFGCWFLNSPLIPILKTSHRKTSTVPDVHPEESIIVPGSRPDVRLTTTTVAASAAVNSVTRLMLASEQEMTSSMAPGSPIPALHGMVLSRIQSWCTLCSISTRIWPGSCPCWNGPPTQTLH